MHINQAQNGSMGISPSRVRITSSNIKYCIIERAKELGAVATWTRNAWNEWGKMCQPSTSTSLQWRGERERGLLFLSLKTDISRTWENWVRESRPPFFFSSPIIRTPHPKTDNWTRVYWVLPNIFLYNQRKEKSTPFRYYTFAVDWLTTVQAGRKKRSWRKRSESGKI